MTQTEILNILQTRKGEALAISDIEQALTLSNAEEFKALVKILVELEQKARSNGQKRTVIC